MACGSESPIRVRVPLHRICRAVDSGHRVPYRASLPVVPLENLDRACCSGCGELLGAGVLLFDSFRRDGLQIHVYPRRFLCGAHGDPARHNRVPTISVARIHRSGVLVGILVAFVCTTLASFGATSGGVTYTDADAEGSAINLLRTLNVALDAYAKKYDRGYVDMLRKLGRTPHGEPDMNHAVMFSLDERSFEYRSIPNTFEKKGYIFTYTAGMDSSDKVASYTITARPAGKGGKRSFYSDQTYILRATNGNRPAHAADPPF